MDKMVFPIRPSPLPLLQLLLIPHIQF